MVDKSKVGLQDDPATMPIERGKIREFARACLSTNPEYVDAPSPVSPPTFLTTVNFWMGSGTSPLAAARHRPPASLARGPGVRVPRSAAPGGDASSPSRRGSTASTRRRGGAGAR